MPKLGACTGPGSAPLPGAGGNKYSRSSIVFIKRADEVKSDGGVENHGRRVDQCGANGGKHTGRQSTINGRNGRAGQTGARGQERGCAKVMERNG